MPLASARTQHGYSIMVRTRDFNGREVGATEENSLIILTMYLGILEERESPIDKILNLLGRPTPIPRQRCQSYAMQTSVHLQVVQRADPLEVRILGPGAERQNVSNCPDILKPSVFHPRLEVFARTHVVALGLLCITCELMEEPELVIWLQAAVGRVYARVPVLKLDPAAGNGGPRIVEC